MFSTFNSVFGEKIKAHGNQFCIKHYKYIWLFHSTTILGQAKNWFIRLRLSKTAKGLKSFPFNITEIFEKGLGVFYVLVVCRMSFRYDSLREMFHLTRQGRCVKVILAKCVYILNNILAILFLCRDDFLGGEAAVLNVV